MNPVERHLERVAPEQPHLSVQSFLPDGTGHSVILQHRRRHGHHHTRHQEQHDAREDEQQEGQAQQRRQQGRNAVEPG